MDSPENPKFHIAPNIYFGIDMTRYYAIMLLDEVVPRIIGLSAPKVPLIESINKYYAERAQIKEQLKTTNHYFSEDLGGSVFMNHKGARAIQFPNDGDLSKWQQEHIHATTNTDEAFKTCLELVKKWWK